MPCAHTHTPTAAATQTTEPPPLGGGLKDNSLSHRGPYFYSNLEEVLIKLLNVVIFYNEKF